MNILLKISGTMERYFPATEFHFKLGNDATLSDLYEELAIVAGADISPAVQRISVPISQHGQVGLPLPTVTDLS